MNNKEIYPLFARTVPDSMGESIAIVKYFCHGGDDEELVGGLNRIMSSERGERVTPAKKKGGSKSVETRTIVRIKH